MARIKRKDATGAEPNGEASTPSKRRRTIRNAQTSRENAYDDFDDVNDDEESAVEAATPSGRKRGRPKRDDAGATSPTKVNGDATPSTRRKRAAAVTPVKLSLNGTDTPSRRNLADRSARRKSARALIDRVVAGASDDEEVDDEIQQQIYESSEDEDAEDTEGGATAVDADVDEEEEETAPTTPSRKPRGRAKGSGKTPTPSKRGRKKSPSPPPNLPAHEQYFFHNKPGLPKTSGNTLSSLDLLSHDEYFTLLRAHKDRHADDTTYLRSLHAESFPQWIFELTQGFSLCLYGYGSKRRLMHDFATALFKRDRAAGRNSKIVVINGYVRTITAREIVTSLAAAVDPSYKLPAGNPATMAHSLIALLDTPPTTPNSKPTSSPPTLKILLNSIDAPPLRKPQTQSLLARLASHPRIRLACTADTPDFPLLWDAAARASFAFCFHDATTFAPFSAELDVVDDVHELLGRRGRRTGGKEGVAFVLRSLPENARALFRLLVGEVLVVMEDEGGGEAGVEWRMVYQKAVEEFICSSEMAFRTLLKEFHDHQMITSRKDVLGTEMLSLPFRKEELEAILEDLVS